MNLFLSTHLYEQVFQHLNLYILNRIDTEPFLILAICNIHPRYMN